MPLVDKQSLNQIYITPPRITDPVREYFGGKLPLDAATEPDNPLVAEDFYTAQRCGLVNPWRDGTFLNPPYKSAELRPFLEKLDMEASADIPLGNRIIALLPNSRSEQHYFTSKTYAHPRCIGWCLVRKRVAFRDKDGKPQKSNPHASILFGYNGAWEAFCEAFGHLGLCIRPGEMFTAVTE